MQDDHNYLNYKAFAIIASIFPLHLSESPLTKAFGTVEDAHYCNLKVLLPIKQTHNQERTRAHQNLLWFLCSVPYHPLSLFINKLSLMYEVFYAQVKQRHSQYIIQSICSQIISNYLF